MKTFNNSAEYCSLQHLSNMFSIVRLLRVWH